MTKRIIKSDNYPRPIAPYSQAVVAGEFVFVSGTGPQDPRSGRVVEGGIREQVNQALNNIKNLLEEVGSSMDDVVKVTVFLTDIGNYGAMNEVYRSYFAENAPARTCVQVARLPGDILVEIEAIARLRQDSGRQGKP